MSALRTPGLTYWQASALKMAMVAPIRRMTSPAIPSLVKRGLMKRSHGRPGVTFYAITDAGRAAIAKATGKSS